MSDIGCVAVICAVVVCFTAIYFFIKMQMQSLFELERQRGCVEGRLSKLEHEMIEIIDFLQVGGEGWAPYQNQEK